MCAIIGEWASQSENSTPEETSVILDRIYFVANCAFRELSISALNGNERAGFGILKLTESNLSALNELCHKNPALFEPIARNKLYWPSFISNLNECKKRNEELLAMLNLGKDFGLNTSAKQPNWNSPDISVVMWLHQVAKLRHRTARFDKKIGRLTKSSRLQPLNKKNYKQWFEASWPLFISYYGEEFQSHRRFSHLIASAEKMSATEKKKTRGILRRYIKKRLLSAFKQISAEVDLHP